MAILRKNDRVLMCHRHPNREWVPNVWDFPGGHIAKDETPQQAQTMSPNASDDVPGLGAEVSAQRVTSRPG